MKSKQSFIMSLTGQPEDLNVPLCPACSARLDVGDAGWENTWRDCVTGTEGFSGVYTCPKHGVLEVSGKIDVRGRKWIITWKTPCPTHGVRHVRPVYPAMGGKNVECVCDVPGCNRRMVPRDGRIVITRDYVRRETHADLDVDANLASAEQLAMAAAL